jgi:hypothetical protein
MNLGAESPTLIQLWSHTNTPRAAKGNRLNHITVAAIRKPTVKLTDHSVALDSPQPVGHLMIMGVLMVLLAAVHVVAAVHPVHTGAPSIPSSYKNFYGHLTSIGQRLSTSLVPSLLTTQRHSRSTWLTPTSIVAPTPGGNTTMYPTFMVQTYRMSC